MLDEIIALPIGEAVRLREGGPVMTVERTVEHLLLCVWVDEAGRVRRESFSPNQLVPHRPADLAWFSAMVRLAQRCKVVAATS